MKMFCIIHFILLRNQRWIVERLRKLLLKMWENNPSIFKYWVCWSDNLSLHFFLNKTDMPCLLVKRYTFSPISCSPKSTSIYSPGVCVLLSRQMPSCTNVHDLQHGHAQILLIECELWHFYDMPGTGAPTTLADSTWSERASTLLHGPLEWLRFSPYL